MENKVIILYYGYYLHSHKHINFFENYENHKKNMLSLFNNYEIYLHTYSYDKIQDKKLINLLRPTKYIIEDNKNQQITYSLLKSFKLLDNNSNIIICLRFNILFLKSYKTFNIKYNKFNIIFRDLQDFWKNEKKTSDLFYVFPSIYIKQFALSVIKTIHIIPESSLIYNDLSSLISSDNIHFILDGFYSSDTENNYNGLIKVCNSYNYNKIIEYTNIKRIPKIIHCTYHNYDSIPQKVWDNIKKYAGDYILYYYSDNDCLNFLQNHYGERFVSMFKDLKIGAHKADFFRYCILYIYGGIYIDIKIFPQKHFKYIFNHTEQYLTYTCLGRKGVEESLNNKKLRILRNEGNGHIFQAIIATYSKNIIFKDLINDFFIIDNPHDNYDIFTYKFYDKLVNILNKHPNPGQHVYDKNKKIILFGEKNIKINNEKTDKYNGYFYIFDENNKLLMKSRYSDFPWIKIEY